MAGALTRRDIEMIFRAETDAAQRPVTELTSDVRKLRETLADLVTQSGKTDKSLDALTKTTIDLEKAQSELGNARTLLNQLNSQQLALDKTEASLDKAQKKYDDLKARVEGAEAPTKRLTNSLEAAQRALDANNERLTVAKKNFGETKGQIEAIIGPVDNLRDAFRTVAVSQAEVAQGIQTAKGAVQGFKNEILETSKAAKTLEIDEKFRKIGTDSLAALEANRNLGESVDTVSQKYVRLADAILGITNPAAAAAQNLDGIDAKLDATITKLNKGKLSSAQFGEISNDLVSIEAGLIGVSKEIDRFTAQEARVAQAATAFEAQKEKVRELATALLQGGEGAEQLARDLKAAEAGLETSGNALDRETAKLNELSIALKRVGVDSSDIPLAMKRIEQSATRAAPAIKKVGDVIGPRAKGGFLGLRPHELQNLSFQINDVFTSLASGISPAQTLAQQSGQIAQIPGVLAAIVRWLPGIAAVGVAIAVVVGAISEANTQLDTVRQGEVLIARLGETSGATAKTFADLTNNFRTLGASAKDAQEAASNLIESGLNPKAYDDVSVAATNLAAVTGGELTAATKEVTDAFTGGATEVLKLDDKYHFLTDTQRDQILASKDTKKETEEVNKAFTALYNKMQTAANAQRTEFSDAADTLRGAWHNLLETFADTGIIDGVTKIIANAITGLSFLINLAVRAKQALSADGGDAFRASQGDKEAQKRVDARKNGPGILEQALADTKKQRDESQRRFNQQQTTPVGTDLGAGSRERQKLKEKQDIKDRKQADKDAKAEAKRRAAEAKRLAKEYENEQDQLSSALSRVTAQALKGQSGTVEEQLANAKQAVDEQFKALYDRLQEFKAKFGADAKINGVSQADYLARLQAQQAELTNQKQLGVYESNINDLLKQRDNRLKSIQEQQQAGFITAQQALDQTQEVTSEMGPTIDAAIESARKFIATLKPSNETQALLDKFARISQQGGTGAAGTIDRETAAKLANEEESKLNKTIQERNSLVAATNALYDLGAIGAQERERRIAAAYETTGAKIKEQTDALKAFLEANRDRFDPVIFDTLIAKIQQVSAESIHVSDNLQAVQDTAQHAFEQGFVSMFDTLAQGIANVITGAGSLEDLFSDLGAAALDFAAQFLQAIGQVLLQLAAVQVAKSLFGAGSFSFLGIHGGGTVGDYGGGVMSLPRSLSISDAALAGIPRYHNGTQGAGLKSNEMLAVLERGEKVTTEEQQAAEKRRNAALAKGKKGNGLRQVLAIGDEEVANAMSGASGEDVVLTHLQRRKTTIKQILGIN